jgi:hypothetical protein
MDGITNGTFPENLEETVFEVSKAVVTSWFSTVDETMRQAALVDGNSAGLMLRARAAFLGNFNFGDSALNCH